ncbi:uncharacterized protein JCM6883_004933 [Sporobolomyces salmoneus]|uniref:uncharacterized protein n=1 Tax=Sporobolomyces salmoneus TaxID=183962 RepID=UPI00316F84D5
MTALDANSSPPSTSPLHHSTLASIVSNTPYTPYYCEENVYKLVQALQSSSEVQATWGCFVSNLDQRAILFNQKASRVGIEQGSWVIWDYHVFVVAAVKQGDGERLVVIDRDSKLGEIVDFEDYIERTFYGSLFRERILDPSLESRIRIVPGLDLLQNFASDRSHMLRDTDPSPSVQSTKPSQDYIHPAPPYPAICGPTARQNGESHNLRTHFLDMRLGDERDTGRFGTVLANSTELLKYDFQR